MKGFPRIVPKAFTVNYPQVKIFFEEFYKRIDISERWLKENHCYIRQSRNALNIP